MSNLSETTKLKRPKFGTRVIVLRGPAQRELGKALLDNVPLDSERPLELIVREQVKARSLDQNAAYHAGPLRDIADQAWVEGRQYSAVVWHEEFKREFLPDEALLTREELAALVRNPDDYRKWAITRHGERICVGSTKQLTVKGFAQFMTQVEAFGAGLGVLFSAAPGRG